MAGTVFDTAVYISATESGEAGILQLGRASRMSTRLTATLVERGCSIELLIGAIDKTARRRKSEPFSQCTNYGLS